MMNALEELKDLDWSTVKCAEVTYFVYGMEEVEINLLVGHSDTELINFTASLAQINYNNDIGTQYLFGTIWLRDGTWMERDEYDGSEWWTHCKCPDIPNHLNKGDIP